VARWAGRLLAACLITAVSGLGAPAAPPSSVRAEPAPDWNPRFEAKDGWIGGDAAYSVALGPGRILWLFGDTLLGTVKDGGRPGAKMVNNTIGIQNGRGKESAVRFVSGKAEGGKATAFFTPTDGKGWLWPHAGIRIGDRLFLFLQQVEKTADPGVLGFRPVAQWLAVIENPEDEPEKWKITQHKVPFAAFGMKRERSWGAALLADGGFVYVHGTDEERGQGIGKRRLTVARVPAEKLADFSAWRFRTADGWSDKPEEAAGLTAGLATEFSVSPVPGGKGFVLVYTENGLGTRIVGRFADAPDGPWSEPVLLYRCPETARDKGLFCYSAKAHAWATEEGLLITYCVNAWDFGRLFRDETVYRPRFVLVKFQ
jgi:hypothetical protein